MSDPPKKAAAERDYERQLREINEALLVSSARQHELTEQAQKAEAALRESEERLALELAATQRLQEISTRLIGQENIEALNEQILDAAVAIMRSDMASLQVVDEGKDALRLLAWRGFDPAFGRIFELNGPDTKTSCSVARRHGHRVVVPDVETCEFIAGTPALEDYRKMGIRAVQSTPLFSRRGRVLGMISTHWREPHQPSERDLRLLDVLARQAVDLVERSQAEERLERTVAERTHELRQANESIFHDAEERKKLEEQLLQAQKMESMGILAGGIAHDFNNILNIILAYAFTLHDYGVRDKQVEESLAVINKTVKRGSALVQQLLTLARKSSAELESVNVNLLLEGLAGLVRQTFSKTIEVNSMLGADLPPIMADKNQVEQALLNLCVNARDAMPNGGELTFKTRSVDGEAVRLLGGATGERYVCIEVTDSGTGMGESVRRRIFEPFFTTKDKGRGTGLGLSVVYGIVKSHKGFIDVDSKPMSGTSFRLYFPIARSEHAAEELPIKLEGQRPKRSGGAATVLVVEDERIMLQVLESTLSERGYKVLKATDGEMAIEIYRGHKEEIDVVLLDLGLPKLGGREVLLRLKHEKPDVKAVVTSGYLEPELKAGIAWEGVKFLHKPYMLDELAKTIEYLVERES